MADYDTPYNQAKRVRGGPDHHEALLNELQSLRAARTPSAHALCRARLERDVAFYESLGEVDWWLKASIALEQFPSDPPVAGERELYLDARIGVELDTRTAAWAASALAEMAARASMSPVGVSVDDDDDN